MGKAIEELAHFAAATPWEAIPATVRGHAKLVLLDTLGVILAGSVQPEVAGARARLTATGGHGATVYAPGWPTTDPRTAALLNVLAGRSIELCEGHRYVSCQGAVQVLPTALASGEWLERSGRETLAALIFGYEVAARLGAGLTARPLAHQNGQAPLLGAVAAGARLRGSTAEQMSLALRIGVILALTPGYPNAVAGATALNVAGGMSGFAGALAPELALAGVAAQPNAIEEAFGQLVGDGFQPEAVTEELGQRWEIARNYFRLRACCNPIYSALAATIKIPTAKASSERNSVSWRVWCSAERVSRGWRHSSIGSTTCRDSASWSTRYGASAAPSPGRSLHAVALGVGRTRAAERVAWRRLRRPKRSSAEHPPGPARRGTPAKTAAPAREQSSAYPRTPAHSACPRGSARTPGRRRSSRSLRGSGLPSAPRSARRTSPAGDCRAAPADTRRRSFPVETACAGEPTRPGGSPGAPSCPPGAAIHAA